jgi:hypothetical protein
MPNGIMISPNRKMIGSTRNEKTGKYGLWSAPPDSAIKKTTMRIAETVARAIPVNVVGLFA